MWGRAEQSGGEGHKIHSPSFQTVTWSDLSYYLGLWIRCIIFWICHKKRSPVAPPEMQWTHVQHLDRVLRSVCLSVCWVLRNESCLHLSDAVRTSICPYYVTHSLCVLCISGPLCLIPSDWLSAQNRYKFCFGVFFFSCFFALCASRNFWMLCNSWKLESVKWSQEPNSSDIELCSKMFGMSQ